MTHLRTIASSWRHKIVMKTYIDFPFILKYVYMKIAVYLSKEAFPGAPSVEESFPE